MRLAFIHGINNQANTPDSIAVEWWDAIQTGWKVAGLARKDRPEITVAYYADRLAAAAEGDLSKAIAMGPGADAQSRAHAIAFLQAYMSEAGVSQSEIDALARATGTPPEAVAQGAPHEGWIINLAGLLERIIPTKGKYLARLFLPQAALYIGNKVLRATIDNKVREQIFDGKNDPVIVVAHSLGSIVGYRLLSDPAQQTRNVVRFITLGSPLSLAMVKPILAPRVALPSPPIKTWINGRHQNDFVTLGRPISKGSIGFDGIIDETSISNDEDDKHCIKRYLSSPSIAAAIYKAL